MGLLAMDRTRSQNPDPLKSKGSATRKGKTSFPAMTYWSGIIQSGESGNWQITKGWATRWGVPNSPTLATRCKSKVLLAALRAKSPPIESARVFSPGPVIRVDFHRAIQRGTIDKEL